MAEVLNKDEKFQQLKQIFSDLNNVLLSKKQFKLSHLQEEFFKNILNETIKQDYNELNDKYSKAAN